MPHFIAGELPDDRAHQLLVKRWCAAYVTMENFARSGPCVFMERFGEYMPNLIERLSECRRFARDVFNDAHAAMLATGATREAINVARQEAGRMRYEQQSRMCGITHVSDPHRVNG